MVAMSCPCCGSHELNATGMEEYQCAHCGTRFRLLHPSTGFVNVVLMQTGNKQIQVIQALREISTQEATIKIFDLVTAKRLTDHPPCVIAANVLPEVGEHVKARLEKAGATVELRPC